MTRGWVLAGLLALAGCGGSHSVASPVPAAPSASGASGPQPASCPVTRPAGPPPPQRAMMNFDRPIAKASDPGWYGNGVLWTQFPPRGFDFIPGPGGVLTLKMPWFRAGRGPVTIDARPLSGPPARFSASVSADAYGTYGFVPAGLVFGRPGCWRLRAHLAGRVLTVVLRVPGGARTGACPGSAARRGPVPAWTRPAWADSSASPTWLHHETSARGRVAAFLFAYPLRAGAPTNPANKVLWVVAVPHPLSGLTISARPIDRARPSILIERVRRPLAGVTSIPSYANVPSPGCWRIAITSRGYSESLDLRYLPGR